ncbi:hypothetical protein MKEN_00572800 [Mycena kentingensis (nom. inval.)]|nr:hypothetical protein MKEN_00572800 [Mycena kentingensis (nom. inval.)]
MARSALDILPSELWETILACLPQHQPAHLLDLADVCVAFQELVVRVYSANSGLSIEDLIHGRQTFRHSNLRALTIYARGGPAQALPATRLDCVLDTRFEDQELYAAESLTRLKRIVDPRQTPSLRRFSMSCDWLSVRLLAEEGDPYRVLKRLTWLLSCVASRGAGAVDVMYGQEVFTCTAADIAQWNLLHYRFNPPGSNWRLSHRPKPPPAYPPRRVKTRTLETKKCIEVSPLTRVASVDVHLLHERTILFFNPSSVKDFLLGRKHSELLSHIHAPRLRRLRVNTNFLDACALHTFLLGHSTLEVLDLWAYDDSESTVRDMRVAMTTGSVEQALLVDPPLAHPSLRELNACSNGNGIGRLLPGLIDAPRLESIAMTLPAFAEPLLATVILHDLRALSARPRTGGRIKLRLKLTQPLGLPWWRRRSDPQNTLATKPAAAWARHPEALALAAETRCVRAIHVSVWSVHAAEMLLPWLAAFPGPDTDAGPGLEEVAISLYLIYSRGFSKRRRLAADDVQRMGSEFRARAEAELGHVPTVVCHAY